jgi:hypothetical protein
MKRTIEIELMPGDPGSVVRQSRILLRTKATAGLFAFMRSIDFSKATYSNGDRVPNTLNGAINLLGEKLADAVEEPVKSKKFSKVSD